VFTASFAITSILLVASLPGDAAFLAGALAEMDGDAGTAQSAFARCAAEPGPYQHYAQVRLGDLLRSRGDQAGAARAYQSVLENTPRGPWHRMAGARLARVLAGQGRIAEAAAHFDAVLDVAHVSWWLEPYAWAAAENAAKVNPADPAAYKWFDGLAATTLYHQTRKDAADQLARSSDPGNLATAVFGYLRSSMTTEAAAVLRRADFRLAPPPGGTAAGSAELMALIEGGVANHMAARDRLAQLAGANPANVGMPVWLFYGVSEFLRSGKRADAALLCELLETYYPQSREMGEALWLLAKSVESTGAAADAALWYHKLAESDINHRLAPWALYHAGRLWLASGQETRGLTAWAELRTHHPDHSRTGQSDYEAASYFLRKGDAPQATAYFRLAAQAGMGDFFAHRARARLGEAGGGLHVPVNGAEPLMRSAPLAAGPAPYPLGFLAIKAVERVRFLGRHGLEEAEWEAIDLCETFRGTPYEGLIYRLLAESGLAHTAMGFAQESGWGMEKGRPTVDRLRLAFPLAHWEAVQETAKAAGIDPYLVLAIARQESTFRPNLVSHAGASGVMQVMPGTAREVARLESRVHAEDVRRLKYPAASIRLGAFYIMRMIERSGGNLMHAFASYNAGPGNLNKWKRQFGGHNFDDFVEAIPFEETQGYVRKVLGNYAAYLSLYPSPAQ
jgi:soluble lytic murein transglycosylase-like protein/TolA-binding protein